MRPKSSSMDLPPRMLRRTRLQASGKVWVAYYYNGRAADGSRKEIPLGTDLNEAKRKWAELECRPAPTETLLMINIFDRYEREIIPQKAYRTQKDNTHELKQLRIIFNQAPIDSITPQHIAQYRDKRSAKVRANREISLLSHIFNLAREWGYTTKENPCTGVRKNKETPRSYYADDQVWSAVYMHAQSDLKNAMDLAYLTGQRPADVLKMSVNDIQGNYLEVQQNKTQKKLRIQLNGSQLGDLLKRILAQRQSTGPSLITTPAGSSMNKWTLRIRFEAAREAAAIAAENEGNTSLANKIKQFQFRDIRPKAASELPLNHASKLLGHTDSEITEKVYRRIGEIVKPTK